MLTRITCILMLDDRFVIIVSQLAIHNFYSAICSMGLHIVFQNLDLANAVISLLAKMLVTWECAQKVTAKSICSLR